MAANHEKTKLDWNCGALAAGLQCYRSADFFEAHEHWESIWVACPQPEKKFLQALIQIAAGLYHFHRGNLRGATSLLTAALKKLDHYPSIFQSIQVETCRAQLRQSIAALENHSDFPASPEIRTID